MFRSLGKIGVPYLHLFFCPEGNRFFWMDPNRALIWSKASVTLNLFQLTFYNRDEEQIKSVLLASVICSSVARNTIRPNIFRELDDFFIKWVVHMWVSKNAQSLWGGTAHIRLSPLHKLITRTICHRHAHEPTCCRQFLNWGFLLKWTIKAN